MQRPKVLVVGGGGREHALALALRNSPSRPEVTVTPGSDGIATCCEIAAVAESEVIAFATERGFDLVVVGPEAPLANGIADALLAKGIPVLGPSGAAAQLEASKSFAKEVMAAAQVPTARFGSFTEAAPAIAFARELGASVVKADGLAAGKGVVVTDGPKEAEAAITEMLSGKFGAASTTVVVEERLVGEELSVIALTDGERIALLAPSQDHKRVFDGDAGPNTGGMGAYSPVPTTEALLSAVDREILRPVVEEMARRNTPYRGVLYAGLMLTDEGPKVLEFNVRFGDPEAQVILPRIAEDTYQLFRAVASGRLERDRIECDPRSCVTVVLSAEGYPASPRKGDLIEGLEEAAALPGIQIIHAGTKRTADGFVTAGGRVLSVTAMASDLRSAVGSAYRAVECIRWPGMHYRKDIAHRGLG